MRPLYIVGTERHIGKTTVSLGLLYSLRKRGLRVGYVKPLGQRFATHEGHLLHDDALLVASCFSARDVAQTDMAIPLPSGRVEREVFNLQTSQMTQQVIDACERLSQENDLVVIEGMGHVAMGGCLGVSAGDVCRIIGARPLLVSGGGIGRAIDEILLCSTFLESRGADFMGCIVNKVWPEKYTRVHQATTQGLANMGIRSFGTMPFETQLTAPTMEQVYELVGGTLLGGREHLNHRVRQTIIAAMQAKNMIRHIQGSTLVIVPGDRDDNIMAALRAHMLGDEDDYAVSGMVLTGSFPLEETVLSKVSDFHLPVISVEEDTLATANKIMNTIFKIQPGDRERIEWAFCLVEEYVDVDAILHELEAS